MVVSASFFCIKQSKKNAWLWRWRHYSPSEYQERLAHWHRVMFRWTECSHCICVIPFTWWKKMMEHLAAVLKTVNLWSLVPYLIQLTLLYGTVQVKKRRQERELERQQREEEMALMQRSKEAAQFQEWERQEDQFHLEQARLRSCIRIQDGRGVKTLVHWLKCYAVLMSCLFVCDIGSLLRHVSVHAWTIIREQSCA